MKRNRPLLVSMLVIAAVVMAMGVWLEHVVSSHLERQLREDLTTLRATNVEALEVWMKSQRNAAKLAAAEHGVAETALAIIRGGEAKSEDPGGLKSLHREFAQQLASTMDNWEFEGFLLIAEDRVVAADTEDLIGRELSAEQAIELRSRIRRDGTYLTRPRPMAGGDGQLMWVAAGVEDEGKFMGSLAFRIDPAKSFTNILHIATFGESGETYAFDREGLLLSSSRFDKQLHDYGLLKDGQDSILTLELRNPGVDLTKDGAALPENLKKRELTLAVREASRGRKGDNVHGYRDYRGVPVAGAWTWLPEYGFGVTTEIDVDEAYASTKVVRWATHGLVVVLVLASLVIALSGQLLSRLRNEARRLGQYTLEGKIGEGGMGAVYRARHALLRRPTAIKMIKKDDIDDKTRERFEREVQSTARLCHPNTIAIYDYGHTEDGVFYYAMEFLAGVTLHQLVERFGPMPQGRVIQILIQALGSLGEAHDAGLVHRDIKPANIMLCYRGAVPDLVKVLDFGLVKNLQSDDSEAHLTATNALTGTPHYMSPEAIVDGQTVDHRSDIYAIGAVGYFLLTGRQVFSAPNMMAVLTRHITDPPPPISKVAPTHVDERLEKLIMRCLAKSPDDRPQTAVELIRDLQLLTREERLNWTYDDGMAWWKEHEELTADPSIRSVSNAPTLAIDMQERVALGSAEKTVTMG